DSVGGALEDEEVDNLAFSARLITMEIGLRFLTDFLEGDIYFKIRHKMHNLDRARNQFQLVRSMEAQIKEMEAVVEESRSCVS
ncbi:MAG: mucin desulfatase, partial [Opitutae bacterium]|nr:mucin desulfatase [Opitutae bacterium]